MYETLVKILSMVGVGVQEILIQIEYNFPDINWTQSKFMSIKILNQFLKSLLSGTNVHLTLPLQPIIGHDMDRGIILLKVVDG